MKNIEFYYDELYKKNCTSELFDFACEKGMFCRNRTNMAQDLIWWLNEEHQILDREEREYLGNIIRPFSNVVKSIEKISRHCEEYIVINYLEDENLNEICFPNFKNGEMYKGMEPNKEYTLEELGL